MANIAQYAGFDDLDYGYQHSKNRLQLNECDLTPDVGGGGSTRPVAGQAWPRGNTRGNG
jgi:hypothetical protein